MSFRCTKSMGASSQTPLGIPQILWQALQLPFKSVALFLPLLLLTIQNTSLFFFSNYYCTLPPLIDLVSKISTFFKGPTGPAPAPVSDFIHDIGKDLRDVFVPAYASTLVSFSISLFLMVATLYTFAMAYVNRSLTPKELEARVARRWYQTLVTRTYTVLLGLGLVMLSSATFAAVMLVSIVGSKVVSGLGITSAGLSFLLYCYLSTRWSMSLVISVVEETWGIGALSWSVELFIGNKKKGTLLTFILMAVQMAIYAVFGHMMMSSGLQKLMGEEIKIGLMAAVASSVWELYAMAVYTIFYYECRKSHGLEGTTVDEGGFIYSRLPATADTVF